MSKVYGPPRTDFGPPPPGYIPGVGRGALAFTTRSDLGPGALKGQEVMPERGQGPAELQRIREAKEREREENTFDEFSGYGGSLFSDSTYGADDEKADMVWRAIEDRMESRYAKIRKLNAEREAERKEKEKPPMKEQFSELKHDLDKVSVDEWAALPDALDYSGQNKLAKEARKESYKAQTAVSDSLLLGRFGTGGHVHTLDAASAPPVGAAGTETDLTSVSQARDRALGMRLDYARESGTQTSLGSVGVDTKGYLTDLNALRSSNISGMATGFTTGLGNNGAAPGVTPAISDVKKFRLLFKSAISSNPTSAPGWIGAARLERDCGRMGAARELLKRACEHCPTSEDVWIEAVEMAANLADMRAILAQAVRFLPKSARIWLRAAEIEQSVETKRAVLRRALEAMPTSEQLWRAAVQLEQPADARILLSRAVELIPSAVDLWLALARLETHENARLVLNRARQKVPNDPKIWLAAAKLEEAYRMSIATSEKDDKPQRQNDPNPTLVAVLERLLSNAIISLESHGASLPRQFWLDEAAASEREGSRATAAALVRAALHIGIDVADRADTWRNDAVEFSSEKLLVCARAAAHKLLEAYQDRPALWLLALRFEREFNRTLPQSDAVQVRAGQMEEDAILERAVTACPTDEGLWLTYAKALWVRGDAEAARSVLGRAFRPCAGSVEVWIAAAKLEQEEREFARCLALLEHARTSLQQQEQLRGQAQTTYRMNACGRIWMKSVKLARLLLRGEEAQQLLEEGLKLSPTYTKLWLMLAQYHEAVAARIILARACGDVPGSLDPIRSDPYYNRLLALPGAVPAWIVEAADGRARTLLQAKRTQNAAAIKTEDEQTPKSDSSADAMALQPSGLEPTSDHKHQPLDQVDDEIIQQARECYAREWKTSRSMSQSEADAAITTAVDKARDIYRRVVREQPRISSQLWISFARCELRFGGLQARARTRAVLERARASLVGADDIWAEAIRLELIPDTALLPGVSGVVSSGTSAITPAAALVVAASAHQACPSSGLLMALAIEAPERPQARKSLCTQALDKRPDDPHVLLAVAKVFWDARKIGMARTWFTRATTASPTFGDTWIYFYAMELECGNPESQEHVLNACAEAGPRYGELWNAVAKQDRVKPLPPAEVLFQAATTVKGIFVASAMR